jgi:hypothetical protein
MMYQFHFHLSSSIVDEIKFCVNWTVLQRNSVAAKICMELQNCSLLVTGTLTRTKKLNYWDSCKLIPMSPTKCHGINKCQGYKRFCILLQWECQELYCRELKKHFLLWEKALWVFMLVCTGRNFIVLCQFSWPEKLNILWHASVCLHIHLGSFLSLGVDILKVTYIM